MVKWQPIETAPKDQPIILLVGKIEVMANWDNVKKQFVLTHPVPLIIGNKPKWREMTHGNSGNENGNEKCIFKRCVDID